MSLINDFGGFLSKEDMLRLAETEEGKKELFNYIMRARTAFMCQSIMMRLGVVPDPQTQADICAMAFDILFRIDLAAIFKYIDEMKEFRDSSEIIGNC